MSAGYLEATVTMAAVAREAGVNALVSMSLKPVSRFPRHEKFGDFAHSQPYDQRPNNVHHSLRQ